MKKFLLIAFVVLVLCTVGINATNFFLKENFECFNGVNSATCASWSKSDAGWANWTNTTRRPPINGSYSGWLAGAATYNAVYPTFEDSVASYTKNYTEIAKVNITNCGDSQGLNPLVGYQYRCGFVTTSTCQARGGNVVDTNIDIKDSGGNAFSYALNQIYWVVITSNSSMASYVAGSDTCTYYIYNSTTNALLANGTSLQNKGANSRLFIASAYVGNITYDAMCIYNGTEVNSSVFAECDFVNTTYSRVGVNETFEGASPSDPTWGTVASCGAGNIDLHYATAPIEGSYSARATASGTYKCSQPSDWRVMPTNSSIIMKINVTTFGASQSDYIMSNDARGNIRLRTGPNRFIMANADVNGDTISNINTSQVYTLHISSNTSHVTGGVWMADGSGMYANATITRGSFSSNEKGIIAYDSDFRIDCFTTYNGTDFNYSKFPVACGGGGGESIVSINLSNATPYNMTTYTVARPDYSNVTFQVLANITSMTNFSFYLDNVMNDTVNVSSAYMQNIPINFTKNLNNGTHQYKFRAFDASYETNTTLNNVSIILTGWPVTINISNITPANNSRFNTSSRDIWVLANISAMINATLVVDGRYNDSQLLNTSFCYQEFANVSTNCGGLNSGTYLNTSAGAWCTSINNIIDGDYNTYGEYCLGMALLEVNYTIPYSATNNSLIQAKHGSVFSNFSIPNSCWQYAINTANRRLTFNLSSGKPFVTFTSQISCWNGTGSVLISSSGSGSGPSSYFYEEAMFWDMRSPNVSFTKSFNEGWHNVSINFTDGLYSTNTSTNWFLYTSTPIIDHVEIHPQYPNSSTQFDCHTQYSDPNLAHVMNASIAWWSSTNNVTWTNVHTYDYLYTGTSGTVEITTGVGTGSWTAVKNNYTYYRCEVNVTDGLTNMLMNSSTTGIFPLENVNYSSVPNNNTLTKNSLIVNYTATDWDGGINCTFNINGSSAIVGGASSGAFSCFQEDPKVVFGNDGPCTLNYGGTNASNITDILRYRVNDGDTASYVGFSNGNQYNVTYMKPIGALNSSVWEIVDVNATSIEDHRNLTIPADCWSYSSTSISFAIYRKDASSLKFLCWNGTSLNIIGSTIAGFADFNEERMWWNITNFTTSATAYNVPSNTTSNQFIISPNISGNYLWNLSCVSNGDTVPQYANNSRYEVYRYDNAVPGITGVVTNVSTYYPEVGNILRINATLSDNINLSYCMLQVDNGVSYDNVSNITIPGNVSSYWWNTTYLVTASTPKTANYKFYCQDYVGNYNTSDVFTFTVKNITGPVITNLAVTPSYPGTTDTLNCQFAVVDNFTTTNTSVGWWYSSDNVTWTRTNPLLDGVYTNLPNNTLTTTTAGTGSFPLSTTDYNYYMCQVTSQGIFANATLQNSSSIGIFPLHNLTVYNPPNNTFSRYQMTGTNNVTFSVTDWDGGIYCVANDNGSTYETPGVIYPFLVAENFECPNGAGKAACEWWNVSRSGWSNFTTTQRQPAISGTYSAYINSTATYRYVYPTKLNDLTGYTRNFTTIVQMNMTDYGDGQGFAPISFGQWGCQMSINRSGGIRIGNYQTNGAYFRNSTTAINLSLNKIYTVVLSFNGSMSNPISQQDRCDGFIYDETGSILIGNGTHSTYAFPTTNPNRLTVGIYMGNSSFDNLCVYNGTEYSTSILEACKNRGGIGIPVTTNTNASLNITFSQSGDYLWNMSCISNGNSTGITSDNYVYHYDAIIPTIGSFVTDASTIYPQIGDTLHINMTITDNYNVSNCTLMMNNTIILGSGNDFVNTSVVVINQPSSYFWQTSYLIGPNSTRNVSNMTYKVRCFDAVGNVNDSVVQKVTIRDVSIPNITVRAGNSISFYNDTHFSSRYGNNLTINISFADANLFGVLAEIVCETSGSVFYFEQIDINTTTYNLTQMIDYLDLYPLQHCYLRLEAVDDHTAYSIPDYQTAKTADTLEYTTPENSFVSIKALDANIDSIGTSKSFDRYKFDFGYADKQLTRQFIVQTDKELYPRENSKYPGHFVVWNPEEKTGSWVDFDLPDRSQYDYTIEEQDNQTYIVTIAMKQDIAPEELPGKQKGILSIIGLGKEMTTDELVLDRYGIDKVEFSSIGGLNVENITAGFYLAGTINISNFNIYGNTTFNNGTVYVVPITASNMTSGTYTYSNINYTRLENLTNGTYYITFDHPQYFNQTYLVNMSNVTQRLNYSTFQSQLNIRVRNVLSGTFLANYTINLTNSASGRKTNNLSETDGFTINFLNATTYSYIADVSNATGTNYLTKTGSVAPTYKENLTVYIDMGFNTTMYFIDEDTLTGLNTSIFDTATFDLFCPTATYSSSIKGASNITLPINCTYDKFRFTFSWTSGGFVQTYYRTVILGFSDINQLNQSIFLINPFNSSYLYNSFVLDDLLNTYQNPRLFIKKNIGASSVQITADFVDAEKKVFAFLLTNDEYTIELHSDNNAVRVLGNYVAATSGDKALHVYDIQATPGTSTTTFRNGVSVYLGTTNISNSTFFAGLYNDTFNKTSRIDLYVYKMNYSGDILMHTQVNASELYATLNLTPYDFTVVSEFRTLDTYGTADNWKQMVKHVISANAIITDFINTLANVTADSDEGAKTSIRWFFILIFSMIALTATIASAEYMAIVLVLGIGLVWLLGWLPLPANVPGTAVLGLLGAAALIAFFAMFKKKEKEI